MQLSKKAITDKVTRILVFFGAAAGVLYNALWYFPILMLAGAIVTAVWDYRWGHRLVKGIRDRFKKHPPRPDVDAERQATSSSRDGEEMQDVPRGNEKSSVHEHDSSGLRRVGPGGSREGTDPTNENAPGNSEPESAERNRATDTAAAAEEPATDVSVGAFSLKVGISVGVGFFLVFIAVMVLRALLDPQPRWYGIFANHFLAGTSLPPAAAAAHTALWLVFFEVLTAAYRNNHFRRGTRRDSSLARVRRSLSGFKTRS